MIKLLTKRWENCLLILITARNIDGFKVGAKVGLVRNESMGEFRQYVFGEPIVFDGSLSHFAITESNTGRALFIF
jgi:hypothetical protein